MPSAELCEICGKRRALFVCPLCKRRVCEHCFSIERGMCLVCLQTMCERCGRKHSVERCQICGRLICPDCLIRVDKARAICLDCFNALGKDRAIELIRRRSSEERRVLQSRLKLLET